MSGVADTDADAHAGAGSDRREAPATADGFAALELDARLLTRDRAPSATRSRRRSSARRSRRCWPAATCSPRRRPGPARRPRSRCRPSSASPSAQAGEGGTSALVLVPTRELAMQVAEALHKYGRELGARVLPVYGGQPIGQQLRGLRRGVDVVVATPGRAVDHLKRGSLRFDGVAVVILDEADEMLDMGFAEDLEAILSATPAERQTALFSATISPTITRIAKRHLRDPARIKVHAEKADRRRRRARPPGRLRRPPDRQAGRAVPDPRRRGPDLGARLRAGRAARSTTSPRR